MGLFPPIRQLVLSSWWWVWHVSSSLRAESVDLLRLVFCSLKSQCSVQAGCYWSTVFLLRSWLLDNTYSVPFCWRSASSGEDLLWSLTFLIVVWNGIGVGKETSVTQWGDRSQVSFSVTEPSRYRRRVPERQSRVLRLNNFLKPENIFRTFPKIIFLKFYLRT